MTPDQEQLVTMLFIKHGGRDKVVDSWLFGDANGDLVLTQIEVDAVDAWLSSPKHTKSNRLKVVKEANFKFLTTEIALNMLDKD